MNIFIINFLTLLSISIVISIIVITPRKVIIKQLVTNTKSFRKEFLIFPIICIIAYYLIGISGLETSSISQSVIVFMIIISSLLVNRLWKLNE